MTYKAEVEGHKAEVTKEYEASEKETTVELSAGFVSIFSNGEKVAELSVRKLERESIKNY